MATIAVYSVSGAVISTTDYKVDAGTNAVEIDMSRLEKGTYFVAVSSNASASGMLPVVKQ